MIEVTKKISKSLQVRRSERIFTAALIIALSQCGERIYCDEDIFTVAADNMAQQMVDAKEIAFKDMQS